MRIMEWNLQYGGSQERFPGILEAVRRHNPDLLVLLEFRPEKVIEVSLSLAALGYPYILNSQPPPRTNGILTASKTALRQLQDHRVSTSPHRWMEVSPEGSDLRVLAVHIPGASDLSGKLEHWRALMDYAQEAVDAQSRAVIIGDLNTGLAQDTEGTPFLGQEHLSSLLDMGWRDVWREYHRVGREYSWYSSSGKGMRTDHALASPHIHHPMWAKYSHHERETGLSDHSVLIMDIMPRMNESGSRSSPLFRIGEGPGCSSS
ncbi:MAG: Endonuclease/Exonuclease/phosphatase family protein [Methanomassiliicoccales archaeon PtaB.Bin134]|jgi:exonuclease III|nr:MAG: Endonuclease/Exonuclease/phosphatase family protein [Methanomassiliicoccales archaeon PtaB.Bin134]